MADRYWRGGAGTWNTTLTTNWATTSGGSGGASVPTAADNVIFDQAGAYNVTMTGALACLSITVSAGTVSFLTGTSPTLAISGSMSLVAGTVWTSTGNITFNSTTTGRTVTTNGVTINGSIIFDGVGGAWSLGSALTTGVTLITQLNNGSLNLNGFDLNTGSFSSNTAATRSIAFGTKNIVLNQTTSAATVLNMATATGFTWTGTTGGFTATAAVAKTFVFGTTGGTATNAPNLTFTGSGTLVQTLTTGSWFNKLDYGSTVYTQASSTLNVNSITLSTGGTYTALTLNIVGSGTLIFNSKSCSALSIGHTGTTTLGSAGAFTTFTTTLTPTLDCAGFSFVGTGTMTWPATTTVILGTNGTFGTTGQLNVTGQTLAPTTGQTYRSGTFQPTSCTVDLTLGGTLTIGGGVTLTSTAFTYGGTSTLTLAAFNFSQNTGSTVTFNKSVSGTDIYNHTAGTLTIASGVTLDVGAYSSAGSTTTRSIAFGTASAGNINLNTTVATASVININNSTGFSATGPGGFTRDASIAVTINVSQTGASSANAPNVTLTGSGTAVITISTNSWFNKLDFGTTAFALATTILNVNSITLSSGGTFTTTTINAIGTGQVITSNKTISTVTINHSGTTTLGNAITCTSFNQTAGSINFQSFNINCTNFNWTTGTYTNMGTITAVSLNVAGTFDFISGTINASNTISITGPFTYGGTASLGNPSNFNHTSSTVTFNKSYTLTSATYTFTAGTLTLNSSVTLATFSSSNSNTRNIEFNTYYITITSLSMATATGFSASGTGGFSSTMSATRTFNCGATAAPTVAPNLSIIGGASIPTFTSGSWFKNLDFTGSTCTPAVTTINLAGITLSATGNFANLGTLILTGSGNLRTNGNVTLNTPTFSGTGTTTLTGTCSFASGSSITHTSGTIDLNGFDLYCGNSGSLGVYDSGSSTGARTVIFGTNNIICTAISCAVATGFTWTGTTGGFQIPATTSSLTVFGTTNGSTTNVPNLTFTAGAWGGGVISSNSWFNKLTFNSGVTGNPGTTTINVNSLELSSGGTFTGLTIVTRATGTITSNGNTTLYRVTIGNGAGITTTLNDALTLSNTLTLSSGTLNSSTFSVTSPNFSSTSSLTRNITGSGTFTFTGTGTTFNVTNITGLTISGITISMTGATSKTFNGGGGSYPVLNQGGAGALIISGNNSFSDLTATTRPSTITFTASSTQTFAAFTLSGVLGSLVTINSTIAGTQAILSKASGTVSAGYLSIQDSNATGGAVWNAGTTSTNVSNNLGWIFPVGGYAGNFFAFF